MSSESRQCMVIFHFGHGCALRSAVLRHCRRRALAQHCTAMTYWANSIQCLGSDDIMSLGIKSSSWVLRIHFLDKYLKSTYWEYVVCEFSIRENRGFLFEMCPYCLVWAQIKTGRSHMARHHFWTLPDSQKGYQRSRRKKYKRVQHVNICVSSRQICLGL